MMKLIRDKIPEIIISLGKKPILKIAEEEYNELLNLKLSEEMIEYLMSGETKELVDIIEVCFAIAKNNGTDRNKLLEMVAIKREEKGSFNNKIIWLGNE